MYFTIEQFILTRLYFEVEAGVYKLLYFNTIKIINTVPMCS